MSKIFVPDDWVPADGYCNIRYTVPNSPQWLSVVKGQLTDLTMDTAWDQYSGDVQAAIAEVDKILVTIFNPGCG